MLNHDYFEIQVGKPIDGQYPIRVVNSTSGKIQKSETSFLPMEQVKALVARLRNLEEDLSNSEEFGYALYDFLFPPPIRRLYHESCEKIGENGLLILLRLPIDCPELDQIPWECCYDGKQFLALNQETPIIRYVPAADKPSVIYSQGQLRILIVAAAPLDFPSINTYKEIEILQQVLNSVGGVEIRLVDQTTRKQFREAIVDFEPHVLHFLGHSSKNEQGEYCIVLSNNSQRGDLMTVREIATLLLIGPKIRFVVLNACETLDHFLDPDHFSNEDAISMLARFDSEKFRKSPYRLIDIAPRLVNVGVPTVIGMQRSIPGKPATLFTSTFYRSLLRGKSIESAITEARRIVFDTYDSRVFWHNSALYTRTLGDRLFKHGEGESQLPKASEILFDYLSIVEKVCSKLHLPYIGGDSFTIPLEEIYVGLKMDSSAPIERVASSKILKDLMHVQRGSDLTEEQVSGVLRQNPYAARHQIYDPGLAEQLQKNLNKTTTYHLAEIMRQYRWVIILGDPGCGKTTVASWIALKHAAHLRDKHERIAIPATQVHPDANSEHLEEIGITRLPILVRIADYAAALWSAEGNTRLPLLTFCSQYWARQLRSVKYRHQNLQAMFREYLEAGRVIFIFDGLDEVPQHEHRKIVVEEIRDLITEYVRTPSNFCPIDSGVNFTMVSDPVTSCGNQIIVTSRIIGYYLHALHQSLPHFIIQPMSNQAITRFCHNWAQFHHLPDKSSEYGDKLAENILNHADENVRQMARNPLMLTILAQVFRTSLASAIPTSWTALSLCCRKHL